MAQTTRHSLYGVDAGGTVIGGITQQSIPIESEVSSEAQDGQVYTSHQSLTSQRANATFTTLDVADALAVAGLTGTKIDDMSGGLTMWAQAHLDGGTRAGASLHRSFNWAKGLLVPRSLSASHGPDATLSMEALGKVNGSVPPPVIAENQTLPAVVDDERYTLGPVKVGAITLTGVRGFDIDFGITVEAQTADGDLYPTFLSIVTITPVLTIRGVGVDAWYKESGGIPLAGLNATHANTAFYLRKRADGGTVVADNVTEHIKFTAAGLITVSDPMDASGQDAAEVNLTMPLVYDGTNAPLTIDVASAIT